MRRNLARDHNMAALKEVEAETATPPPPPRQQQEPSDTIVEEAVEEASRPKRAVKPAGFYRKHASKLDNIIEREAHLAAKARKRKVAKCLPENALEFLGPEEDRDIFPVPRSPAIGVGARNFPSTMDGIAHKRSKVQQNTHESSVYSPRAKPAKRKEPSGAPKHDMHNGRGTGHPVVKRRRGRPRIRPLPEEPPPPPGELPDQEFAGEVEPPFTTGEAYEAILRNADPDDLLDDLNYPTDVPIRDIDSMNGSLAKTLEKEGLDPEGHDVNWEKVKWTQGTYVNCDLRYYNLTSLGKFDVVLIDPPWRLRGAQNLTDERTMFNNSRFALSYNTLSNEEIMDLDVRSLSDRGFIFLWTINSQLQAAFECLNNWGYTYVDKITWIKKTNNANVHISQGFYILHSSEVCIIGVKRDSTKSFLEFIPKMSNDLIFAEMTKKSQKPEQMYVLIERMFPGAKKIELFGRNHNIRPGWLTLGNQLGELYNWDNDIVQCNHCKHLIHVGITRYKHRRVPDSDICAKCWKAAQAKPATAALFLEEDYFRLSNLNDEMAFHEYYECNGCKARPLWGIRFTCEQCPDFDLCEECHDSRIVPDELKSIHTAEHRFMAVETPHLAGGLPIHRIRCAACDLFPIVGYRFKCLDCPAHYAGTLLSLCQKCFFSKKEPKNHKSSHRMELVIEPNMAHVQHKCDICGVKPIVGTRYKCNSCFGFDICEACFLSKRPPPPSKVSHKPTHTYARIQGDQEPENYSGPVQKANDMSSYRDEQEDVSIEPAMRAFIMANQRKKTQQRHAVQEEEDQRFDEQNDDEDAMEDEDEDVDIGDLNDLASFKPPRTPVPEEDEEPRSTAPPTAAPPPTQQPLPNQKPKPTPKPKPKPKPQPQPKARPAPTPHHQPMPPPVPEFEDDEEMEEQRELFEEDVDFDSNMDANETETFASGASFPNNHDDDESNLDAAARFILYNQRMRFHRK